MANRIQIKRSIANSTVTGLNPGELAFTANGNVLYIGHPNTSITDALRIGGLQVPGTLTANQALVANATSGIDKVIVANLVPTQIYANGGFGTANQVLRSDGANVYWSDFIIDVVAGDGLNETVTNGVSTIDVGAGNGIIVNATSVGILANTGLVANATGLHLVQNISTNADVTFNDFTANNNLSVNGNTTLGNNVAEDTVTFNSRIASDLIPSANVTYDVGSTELRWDQVFANNIVSTTASFSGNVSVTGDLLVTGNVTTMNVNSLVVKDPMIYLADNNAADTLDIGFAGTYNDGSTQRYTGFFRDATNGVYRLFANTIQDLKSNNAIDTAAASFAIATLSSYLTSGGLVTNATAVAITANASVAVSITANTMKLSGRANNDVLFSTGDGSITGLALGTSGYVLQSNGTALVYDYLDGGTF